MSVSIDQIEKAYRAWTAFLETVRRQLGGREPTEPIAAIFKGLHETILAFQPKTPTEIARKTTLLTELHKHLPDPEASVIAMLKSIGTDLKGLNKRT